MPDAIRAARPARVDQPRLRTVLAQLLGEHRAVAGRVHRQKRRAETRAEGRLRGCNPALRARHLRRVAQQKHIHRLLDAQAADRGQHAERVRRQKKQMLRMPADAGQHRAVDVVHRVRRARVLGNRGVRVVRLARVGMHHHILHHAAEADGVPNLRLVFAREVDALGVAAAFEVEDARIRPAMFVVANQAAFGVSRQRGLARAAQPEKERDIARRAHIRRAVHRKHPLQRQNKVQHREDGLLDFPRIARACNQHDAPHKVQRDDHLAARTVDRRVGLEVRRVQHQKVRSEVCQLLARRADKELLREQVVPRHLVNHAHLEPIARVRPRVAILHIQRAVRQIRRDTQEQPFEHLWRHRLVDRAPVDLRFAFRATHHELVFRGASRVVPRGGDQRAIRRQLRFPISNRMLHKAGDRKVVIQGGGVS
jgi:hypothetical protein